MRDATPGHLVLVGMMGAGKTTVGRRLADRLGRPFLDSDALVEAESGRTVREIFESEGEDAFRSIERDVVGRALSSPRPAVVAAAGGAVLDPVTRDLMRRSGRVVWLRSDPAVLAERVRSGSHRPLLADDPDAVLRRLAEAREPLYLDVADVVVDVDVLDPDAVVEQVLGATEVTA